MNIPNMGGFDFSALAKGKQAWEQFKLNHPRFPDFLKDIANRGVTEGTNVEIAVTYPNGQKIRTNVKVKSGDVELFQSMKDFINLL